MEEKSEENIEKPLAVGGIEAEVLTSRRKYDSAHKENGSGLTKDEKEHCDISSTKFKKRRGQSTMKGQRYEVKLIALLFLRLKRNRGILEFYLATNVEGAGTMDDILVKYKTIGNNVEWKWCFVQLKHKDTASIEVKSFKENGDFSVSKYIKSFEEIETQMSNPSSGCLFGGRIENCEFVFYTNAKLNPELSKYTRTSLPSETGALLKCDSEEGYVFSFNDEINEVLSMKSQAGEKFLGPLRVFSGQPSESQMDEILKRELFEGADLIRQDKDILHRSYLESIEKWWGEAVRVDGNATFDNQCELIKILSETCRVDIQSSIEEKQYNLPIQFCKPIDLLQKCLRNIPVIHIVANPLTIKLSCTKLFQYLNEVNDDYLFLSLDTLLKETDAAMSAWGSGKANILITASESKSEHMDLSNNLCQHLNEFNSEEVSKKIIVVSAVDDKFTSNLIELVKDCQRIEDTFNLNQLETEYKDKISMKTVYLQGQEVMLLDLCKENDDITAAVFNDDFIKDIFHGAKLSIGPILERTISYYIPRILVRCDVISKGVFKELEDVFMVRDVSMEELQKFVPPGESVGQVGDDEKHRFLVSAPGSDIDCDSQERLHELKMGSCGSFRWIQSRGKIDHIKTFLHEKETSQYKPKTVLDIESRIILVEAPPGMGKSSLVTHLAEETKSKHPITWVIRLDLSKHMGLMQTMSCKDGTEFLESALGIDKKSPSERALFRHSIEVQGNAVALLDGFDEIAPQYTDKCLNVLSSLIKTKLLKIIITTRHSTKEKLETHLSTLAFTLLPFNEQNHRDFFMAFWNRDEDRQQMLKVSEEHVVSQLLAHLEKSLNDKGNELLGVPLHAMLLAEIYEDHIHDADRQVIDDLDLLSLFQNVIDKKLRIYFMKKNLSIANNSSHEMEIMMEPVNKDHMHAALVLLLDDDQLKALHQGEKIIKHNSKFSKHLAESNHKTGIVDKYIGNKAVFPHRTYGEFFAALWFSRKFSKNREILSKILFKREFKMVRRFFDLMLAKDNDLLTSVINNDIPRIMVSLTESRPTFEPTDKGGRSILHLAAASGFDGRLTSDDLEDVEDEHLLGHIIRQGAPGLEVREVGEVNTRDNVFQWTVMEYAMYSGCWDAVDLLLENSLTEENKVLMKGLMDREGDDMHYEWYHEGKMPHHTTAGHPPPPFLQAAAYGHINIMLLILSISDIKAIENYGFTSTPLHDACLRNRVNLARELIANVGSDSTAVREYVNKQEDTNKYSALHVAALKGGIPLYDLLLSNGGDIWALEKYGHTPLFMTCWSNNIIAAQAIIGSLGDDAAAIQKYVRIQDHNGVTALHWASSNVGSRLFEPIIAWGADVLVCDKKRRSPLFNASKANNKIAVRVLMDIVSKSDPAALTEYINLQDTEGVSALHLAAEHSQGEDVELVELLIRRGGEIRARDTKGRTPLFNACTTGHILAVKTLMNHIGSDTVALTEYINLRDYEGVSAIQIASFRADLELVQLLELKEK